jgi:hypothetical protein
MNAVLVNINTVRALRGVNAENLIKLTESGALLWVFNISAVRGGARELRFFLPEVSEPQKFAGSSLEEIIALILPDRNLFGTQDLRSLFLLSRPFAWLLAKSLGSRNTAGNWRVERPVLASYLRRRWIGAAPIILTASNAPLNVIKRPGGDNRRASQ